ncbi:MAG: thrombospondin type 3 repeat-containing protein [Phycisphaerae bacterium]|nr:thrombospondin type 3 repeat-containing protein [Phycisphaerae bacterium]
MLHETLRQSFRVACAAAAFCTLIGTGCALFDIDADGVPTSIDNCPLMANASQEDSDGDGVGNVCDNCPDDPNEDQADPDADFIGSACDNCPDDFNPSQEDGDLDGFGAACDANDSNPIVH